MKLFFIYGLPATGKLTVAQELAAMTGFKLFHNHLTVDLLLSVFDFGTPEFVALREEIWLSVFAEACRSGLPGLIFTFNPESSVTRNFVPNAIRTVTSADGEVGFIELTCPLAEIRKRIDSTSRLQHKKLTSLAIFDQLHTAGVFDASHMPKPLLTIDTSRVTPSEAAAQIVQELALSPSQPVAALSVS